MGRGREGGVRKVGRGRERKGELYYADEMGGEGYVRSLSREVGRGS